MLLVKTSRLDHIRANNLLDYRAIGVGGADAVDAMTGLPWELRNPDVIGEFVKYGF